MQCCDQDSVCLKRYSSQAEFSKLDLLEVQDSFFFLHLHATVVMLPFDHSQVILSLGGV